MNRGSHSGDATLSRRVRRGGLIIASRRDASTVGGFTLVELITALGGVTMLLSLTAVLLTRAMQSQAETRRYFDAQRHALALSEQFRDDVHRATAAQLDQSKLNDGELIRLTQAQSRTVTYRHSDHGIARVIAADGKPAGREDYDLGGVVKADVNQEGTTSRVVLSITAPDEKPLLPNDSAALIREKPALLHVEATLGADRRYADGAIVPGGSP